MLTQTLAIFLDAYRYLNNRRLFWLTVLLSGVVVAAFGAVGIDAEGVTVLHWHIYPYLTSAMLSPAAFYKFVFVSFGVEIWLAWAASILALISTAGIIPEFISQSSIEITLAKPISRTRLFLTKYLSGLLFAALQVTVFSLASFFVIGVRGGEWEPRVFLAIPLVILFFSYLYSVSALIGVLTRSTIASLLGVGLFWFLLFVANTTESIYLMIRTESEQRLRAVEARIASIESGEVPAAPGATGKGVLAAIAEAAAAAQRESAPTDLPKLRERRDSLAKEAANYGRGHDIALAVKTFLPKTSETMDLLKRELVSMSDLAAIASAGDDRPRRRNRQDPDGQGIEASAAQEVERIRRGRSVAWIVGTSAAFEGLILAIAAWRFSRRDY